MICIVASKKDVASMNIAKFLLSIEKWRKKGKIYIKENMMLYFIEDEHIYHDNVDDEIEALGYSIDTIIFASRHASMAKRKTLTVHPVGNFSKAKYGGKDATLILCNPLLMKKGLELLKEKSLKGYEVCYEATHHGPYLKKPCFFIEVGSTEREWKDEKACKTVAEAILQMEEEKATISIGIGGGHYAPRFTEIALEKNVAFGHIAAKYAVKHLSYEMLRKMVEATPNCSKAHFHGDFEEIKEMVKKQGISIT